MTTTDATIDTDLLPRLRRSTGPLHDDIEALLRLEAPMPLMRYGRILRGFHDFLQLWEPRVRQALPERLRPWFDARVRSPFAARDLAALELPEDGADAAMRASALAALRSLRLDCPAAAIGSLYVIEGSALGGQVLTPKLLAAHGLTPEHGTAYFHGFGARTGAMWREFRQVAEAEAGAEEDDRAAACDAAVDTFRALVATFASVDASVDAPVDAPVVAPDPTAAPRAAAATSPPRSS
nr:biliverdin-producing heme oxygenase [uncultured Roseateles sp.]